MPQHRLLVTGAPSPLAKFRAIVHSVLTEQEELRSIHVWGQSIVYLCLEQHLAFALRVAKDQRCQVDKWSHKFHTWKTLQRP